MPEYRIEQEVVSGQWLLFECNPRNWRTYLDSASTLKECIALLPPEHRGEEPEPVETCWICGKEKGQPPERCSGHYTPYSTRSACIVRIRQLERERTALIAIITRNSESSARLIEENTRAVKEALGDCTL